MPALFLEVGAPAVRRSWAPEQGLVTQRLGATTAFAAKLLPQGEVYCLVLVTFFRAETLGPA